MDRLEFSEKLSLLLIVLVACTAVFALITKSQLAINLLCLSILALGLWGVGASFRSMIISINSYRWIPTKYKVVNSMVTSVQSPDGGAALNKFEPHFEIEYEFNYVVHRRRHNELNLHLNKVFATPYDANDYLKKVELGFYGGNVYVNPDDPKVAFIRRGLTRDQIGTFLFSLILLVMSLLTMFDVIEWRS